MKLIRPYYHGAIAVIAGLYHGRPSSKLITIGITGTTGKSTTVQMLARILNYADGGGQGSMITKTGKCGFVTTVSFFDGETEYINKHGLSMPGGWLLQKQLRQMLNKGCRYAIIECTSEGLAQNRHWGISFDIAVFTNLSNAHLETHGGFEAYRKAKAKLFEAISNFPVPPAGRQSPIFKQIQNSKIQISKTIVVNGDDEEAAYFLSFRANRKISVGVAPLRLDEDTESLNIEKIDETTHSFELRRQRFEVKLLGAFNIKNAALAAAVAFALGVPFGVSARAIATFDKIRGRMETVPNDRDLTIIVDYGCEPASIKAALVACAQLPHKRIIHVFGATGGHRDKQKQFIFGQTSAQYADYIIITNDDVYESDPEEIATNIESGIRNYELSVKASKIYNSKFRVWYERVLDRQAAIHRALQIAAAGDIVLITGKGSEQFLVLPGNKRVEWDEVKVVQEALAKI